MGIDFLAVIGRLLPTLAILATKTKSTIDDEIVALLQAIYDSPKLLEWFESKFNADAAGVLSIETDAPQSLVEELRDRKVDWAKLIGYLPTLIALVKALSGK